MIPPSILSYDDLGGTKVDYSETTDDTTDRSADEVNNTCAATAAMTRTHIRVICKFHVDDIGDPTLYNWEASFKAKTIDVPTIDKLATGVYSITFPATVYDEQEEEQDLNLKQCWYNIEPDTDLTLTLCVAQAKITAANQIKVYVNDLSTTLDPVNCYVTVYGI